MPRIKKRVEYHHQPSTHEILLCLESMPKWVDILLENSDKAYCTFVKWYADNDFFKERTDRVTVKQLSKDYGKADTVKITKWIAEVYNDILDLHIEKPQVFKEEKGIRQNFYCKNNDDSASITMYLPVVPRMYEELKIPFLKGKLGVDFFWVCKVNYEIENDELLITVWLRGGFANQYRDTLLQRAEFERVISFYERYTKHDYELDDELRQWYK